MIASIAVGIRRNRGENCHPPARCLQVIVAQSGNGLVTDKRSIAREDDHIFVGRAAKGEHK